MNNAAARIAPPSRASVRTNKSLRPTSTTPRRRRNTRWLKDRIRLFVYGGFTREDLEHYARQPDTLAGVIAARTGSPLQTAREWVRTALPSWRSI